MTLVPLLPPPSRLRCVDLADFIADQHHVRETTQNTDTTSCEFCQPSEELTMQPFIAASDLKQNYGVFGHFYSVELASKEVVECRSVLEIASKSHAPKEHSELSVLRPDAVFIMMNPGSSKPLVEVNNRVRARAIRKLRTLLVPTKPDTTQYQVMRLMHFRNWRHVRVLNLSDLRSPKSAEFIKMFQRLEEESHFDSHSVFSDARKDELSLKLPVGTKTPFVLAWGLSDKLNPLIDRCMSRLPRKSNLMGLLEPDTTNKYRHPLPSLQKDKRVWLDRIVRQFEE
jgi:hypothetical protein